MDPMASRPNAAAGFDQTEINWDKLDKTKLYVVGAGLFTGVTVALYPVSVIKTRMQVASKDAAQKNAWAVFRNILKVDGIFGLYRGFGTVITGAVPARIIFLTSLETTKIAAINLVKPFNLSEPVQAAIANGLGGMAASVSSQAVFVPIDVVSQKLMVQGYSGYANYNGGLDVARKIIKADGFWGLYRGFGLSIMTYSPSSAVWWASYGSSQRVIWRVTSAATSLRVGGLTSTVCMGLCKKRPKGCGSSRTTQLPVHNHNRTRYIHLISNSTTPSSRTINMMLIHHCNGYGHLGRRGTGNASSVAATDNEFDDQPRLVSSEDS